MLLRTSVLKWFGMFFGTAGGKNRQFIEQAMSVFKFQKKILSGFRQLASTYTAVYGAVVIGGRDLKCLHF